VKKWTAFYKKYRAILDSDMIHVRRADARDLDLYLHVSPNLEEKALVMVFNPLDQPVKKILRLPLYYTGLTKKVRMAKEDGAVSTYKLDREFNAELPVELGPQGVTWYVGRE
jgi:hypothetical protein